MKIIVMPDVVMNGHKAITIAPYVFIKRKYVGDAAVLAHEKRHLEQVAAMGWAKWYWRYVTDKSFRQHEEAEGYEVERQIRSRGW